jgi:hypothetical protein
MCILPSLTQWNGTKNGTPGSFANDAIRGLTAVIGNPAVRTDK